MNEKEIIETNELVTETVSGNSGISDPLADDSGNGSSFISGGDNGQVVDTDTSGAPNVAVSADANAVSGGDFLYSGNGNTYTETSTEIQYLETISQGIETLNSTVTLLFFFLLITWAEKKINVVVRRMTEKRS